MRALLVPALLLTALLAGCSGSTSSSGNPSTNPAGDQNAMIDVKDFNFNPTTVNVAKGSSVMWMNEGQATHTVTFDAGGVDSGNIAAGSSYSHTFNDAGTFTYHCKIHSSMTGKVVVS